MSSYLRNPEVKKAAVKLTILHVIFISIILMFTHYEMTELNEKFVDQNTAMVGKVLYKHPELEDDIIEDVTRDASSQEVTKGKQVLKNYDYDKKLSLNSQPVLKNTASEFQSKIAFAISLYLIPLLVFIFMEFIKIYKKIRNISSASESFVEGKFEVLLPEEEEGDFAILGHSFNNMANRLKYTMEKLKDEKIFLKNIISDISHQLKTPLSSLYAINDILIEADNMETEIQNDFLEKNRSQLNRMEWLIKNLLKMARLEAGAIYFKKEKVFMADVIEKSLVSLMIKAQEKNISINIVAKDENKESYFIGDENWMAEALSNIIKNCIEHTGNAGEININFFQTPLISSISIKDNGEGIDKAELPHIFERFYKGSNTVKPESIGIGLALSKIIIESQHGSISVKSKVGQGSEFIVSFLN